MHRLKKMSVHELENRSFAVAVINKKIYTARTHAQCINKFLKEMQETELSNIYLRPLYITDTHDHLIDSYILAHFVTKDGLGSRDGQTTDEIFIEPLTLGGNITMDEAVQILKQKYPTASIYSDDKIYNNDMKQWVYKKLAQQSNVTETTVCRLKREPIYEIFNKDSVNKEIDTTDTHVGYINKRLQKSASHDFEDRDYAVTIINGTVYTGKTHGVCVNKFLKSQGKEKLENTYSREDAANADGMNSFVPAHYVIGDGEQNSSGFNDAIYVEPESIIGDITLVEAVKILKERFPEADIYNDDEIVDYDYNTKKVKYQKLS